MKILVTGSNGLLGQKLVTLLQQQADVQLVATARGASVQQIKKGDFHLLDVTDKNQVESAISSVKPEVIIHTAAMTQVDECEAKREACVLNNVTAVEYLVDACRAN